MLVSVIITTYKHEKFISETIDSILNQTFQDFEILIGDDSPNNDTWNVIEKYVKKYPDKIRARHHEESLWVVKNLKFLMDKVNKDSQYIAFLEWDDIYIPNNLSTKLEVFKKHPDVSLIYNECSIINEFWKTTTKYFLKNQWCKYFYKNESLNLNEVLCSLTPLYHSWSTIMVKSDIIKKYPITIPSLSNHSLVSDFLFFFSVWNNEKIYGIEEPLTWYRVHSNNLSRSINNSLTNDLLKVFEYYFDNNIIDKRAYNKWKTICYATLFLSFTKNALKSLFKSFKSNFFFAIYTIFYKLRAYFIIKKK